MLGALFNGASRGAGSSLEGLLGQLRDGGLRAKVASWTGTGENENISGAEIAQALPPGLLASAARSCGLREVEAADQIGQRPGTQSSGLAQRAPLAVVLRLRPVPHPVLFGGVSGAVDCAPRRHNSSAR
ncbi:YidB family protein [Streptomyces sp. NBC_01386]|uniref:YidB family protein n=1 Tax=Streptomyces sp. NBC_01386 TaxID=2903848 RepID=UPI00386D2027